MAEAAYGQGLCGELRVGDSLHLHRDEAQPDHWDYTIPQRFCGAAGLFLRQDLDQVAREVRDAEAAFHQAREHRYTDLRCCLLRHCFQRYVHFLSFRCSLASSVHAFITNGLVFCRCHALELVEATEPKLGVA